MLPYIVRKVFEIQHKLYQQQVRACSTGRLQEALKIEDEQDYPKINDLKPEPEASQYYYPIDKPFKHDAEVGEQFTVNIFLLLIYFVTQLKLFNSIVYVMV